MTIELETRFWGKVRVRKGGPDDCWVWTDYIDRGGYGIFSIKHRNKKAHRVAWELVNGPIPDGMLVCHKCDNPRCVRPSHMFLGTTQDNMRDRNSKGRQAKGLRNGAFTKPDTRARGMNHGFYKNPERRPRGSRNGHAKLSEEKVREIKALLDQGFSQVSIAKRFNVQKSCICKISKGRTWNHVEVDQ